MANFESLIKVVFLVTGNVHKFNEARHVLNEFGLSTVMLNVETTEIQADSTEEVATASVLEAAEKCGLPIIVEDAGLFVEGLKGFPGPYSSYAFRTIGTEGILKLMKNMENRDAWFESTIAFKHPELKEMKCFRGRVEGEITDHARGDGGFGFDPIFVPHSERRTFAEMTTKEKGTSSHRAGALRRFAEWYVSRFRV